MVQTIPITDVTLHDLREKFNLHRIDDRQFFPEWWADLPELSNLDKQLLDQVKLNYLDQIEYPLMLEDIVKMVVLSPLLSLAGFYRLPFQIQGEASVKLSVADEGEVYQGRIDVLVVENQFWVLVVEAKSTTFSLQVALAQALAYMLCTPYPDQPAFGLMTNGGDLRFVKLTQQHKPYYALSQVFSILNPDNDLYDVLRVMRRIGQLITQR